MSTNCINEVGFSQIKFETCLVIEEDKYEVIDKVTCQMLNSNTVCFAVHIESIFKI